MTIRIDATKNSVLVKCTDCSGWWQIVQTKQAAWRVGASHQASVHGDASQSYQARWQATRRQKPQY